MPAGAELLLEAAEIHRKFPHPLPERRGRRRQLQPDGHAVVVGQGESEVPLVLQPAVQLQIPRLHIGVGVRARRVLHPPLAAVVDAQQVLVGVKPGVIALHVEVVIHQVDPGEQVVLGHDPLPRVTVELKDPAAAALRHRDRGADIRHHPLQHGTPPLKAAAPGRRSAAGIPDRG